MRKIFYEERVEPELTSLGPVLEQIAEMTANIKYYGRQIQQMTQTE
jgi:hypothetical protein